VTPQREPVEPEVGDWIVYNPASTSIFDVKSLGGPWRYAKLKARGVSGWTAVPENNHPIFVLDRDIVRVCLSRGEAYDLVAKLTATQSDYTTERNALKPRFEQRIRDLLNA